MLYAPQHTVQGGLPFAADSDTKYLYRKCMDELAVTAKEGDKFVLTLQKYTPSRTLQQNAMMWALLKIMADCINAGQGGGVTAMDCYLNMLSAFSTEFEYMEIEARAYPNLCRMYRLIQIEQQLEGGKRLLCKAYTGSSKFTTKEMKQLLDRIFDVLAQMDCGDPEMSYWWNRYQDG